MARIESRRVTRWIWIHDRAAQSIDNQERINQTSDLVYSNKMKATNPSDGL